jgi:hypothetical protein
LALSVTVAPLAPVVPLVGLTLSQPGTNPPPLAVETEKAIGWFGSLEETLTDPTTEVCPMAPEPAQGEHEMESVAGAAMLSAAVGAVLCASEAKLMSPP